mgnify:FL=1
MLDYMNQEQENLKNHCTISAIISYICRMKDLGTMMHGKYVTISWEEECKKYIVKLTHTDFINYYNPLGVVIESNQNAKRNQRFEILSWRNSYFIEHNLGKKTILEIAGEKKTDAEVLQEKVASSLLLSGIEKAINSTYATIIKVIADIQNNQENNIKLDTSVTNIEVGNYIKTLGLNGNIIYENNNKVFMQNVMINKVELNIRVHVYNKTNADITIEQLVAGLDEKNSNEVKVLDEYTKWFKSPDDVGMAGKSKVEEYLGDLRSIMQNYANEHPEIKLTNLESLSEEQLRELIKKKENSWYVIKDSIMED